MKVGVATIFYRYLALLDAVKLLIKYTDYIMISPIYPNVTDEEIKILKELRDTYGIEYIIHGPFPCPKGYIIDLDGYNEKIIEQTLTNAYKLESEIVILHPSPREKYVTEIQILKNLYKKAENLGIQIAIENKTDKGDTWLIYDRDFENVIKDFPEIKFCIDTSHYFMTNPNSSALRDLFIKFKDYIIAVHVADTSRPSPELTGKHEEDLQLLPGFGDINWYVVSKGMQALNIRKVPFILEVIYPDDIPLGIMTIRHILHW